MTNDNSHSTLLGKCGFLAHTIGLLAATRKPLKLWLFPKFLISCFNFLPDNYCRKIEAPWGCCNQFSNDRSRKIGGMHEKFSFCKIWLNNGGGGGGIIYNGECEVFITVFMLAC